MKGSSSIFSSNPVVAVLGKSVLLLAPVVVMSAPPVLATAGAIVEAERSAALRDGVFDARLEGKWQALVGPDTGVVIAGDSRAERQIVPSVIAASLGTPAVNLATDAQDLITFRNAVWRHGWPASAGTLIVSTSVFQVNDGAIDVGYLSTPALLHLTRLERFGIYADRLGHPVSPLAFNFREPSPSAPSVEIRDALGFAAVHQRLRTPLPRIQLNEHPWYRRATIDGARWRVFQGALADLASTVPRVYVMVPPVAPAWRRYTANTFVDRAERAFAAQLQTLVQRWPHVRVLDFYREDPGLGDEWYSDIQHLNADGARVLSGMIAREVADRP